MNEINPSVPQTDDVQHLKLLSIFHYIVAGITFLFGCIPIIHLVMGIAMMFGGMTDNRGQQPPFIFGLLFTCIPACFICFAWAVAVCMALTGTRLKARTHYQFCFVVACVECIFMPLGTVLGIFTILVLNRPSVKAMFTQTAPSVDAFPPSENL